MANQTRTVRVETSRYADHDDCLSAAAAEVASDEGVEAWQCEAAWVDGYRTHIVVTISEVQS